MTKQKLVPQFVQLPQREPRGLNELSSVADAITRRNVFMEYRERRSENTLRQNRSALDLFAAFISEAAAEFGIAQALDLYNVPDDWAAVSFGLVEAFKRWMLQGGYAVSSVNVRLSVIKTYAKLAFKAGAMDQAQYALIKAVEGFSYKETRHVDEKRAADGTPTRIGDKKSRAVTITRAQAKRLKDQPETPQGRRDRLLMCLLLDHGLRVSEVALLKLSDFDLETGTMTFYRPKVAITQMHRLSPDTQTALRAWFASGDCPADKDASLLRASRKGGRLTSVGISTRSITERVRVLGEEIGLVGLSAHDCRHFWATQGARKVEAFRLQEAGGWSSLAMPRRYVETSEVANEGWNWE